MPRWFYRQQARYGYRRALVQLRKGNLDQALDSLSRALSHYPCPAQIHVELGIVHWQRGQIEAAIVAFSEAIALDPTQVRAYGNRGLLYSLQGQVAAALADWQQALKHQPGHPLIHYNRGLLYLQQADYAAALADFDQAIAANPNRAEAYLHRGNVYDQLGRQAEAARDWELALCNDLNLGQARRKLDQALQASGDRALAEKLQVALNLDQITVAARQQANELTIELSRPVGVGINYFTLPDQIRQVLISWQSLNLKTFQLIARVGGADQRPGVMEWQGRYVVFQGQSCPPVQWHRVLLTAFVIFPPLGIPALVYAINLKQAYQRGDYLTAVQASKTIRALCRAGGAISLTLVTLVAGYWGYQQLHETRVKDLPSQAHLNPSPIGPAPKQPPLSELDD